MMNTLIEYLEEAPSGFGLGKMLRDPINNITDCRILFLNRKIRHFLSEHNIDPEAEFLSNMFKNDFSDILIWINKEIQSVLKEKTSEREIHSPVFKGWYKIRLEYHEQDYISLWFDDISSENILIETSQRIVKNQSLSVQTITENALKITGARYCLLNLFSEDGKSFTTVDIAGISKDLPVIKDILGFDPINKTWGTRRKFVETPYDSVVHHIDTFDSFIGVDIPAEKLKRIKALFNIGRLSLCRIESDDRLLGIMTFAFDKGHSIQNEYTLINFAQIIGLYLNRKKLQEENQKKELEIIKNRKRLEREKERLESVIKGINAGIWEWEIETGKTIFNERWAQMLGYSLTELEPTNYKTWSSLVFEEDLPKANKALQDHLEKHTEFYDMEIRMKHKTGRIIWVQDMGRVEKWSDDGSPLVMYGTHQDITERKANEMALRNAKKEKEEFFASISHDLKTPMHSIIGFAHLLRESLKNPEDIDCVNSILDSSDNMMKLINNILDFSKAEAGRLTIVNQKVDLRRLIEKNCKNTVQRLKGKQLEINCLIEEELPEFIVTDPLRVNQILMNLLDNAVKFTEKGVIALKVSSEVKDFTRTGIRFLVKDTGIGMTQEELKGIRSYFSQANNEIERKYGGSGLGLFITSKILELMDSRLEISSRKGEGSEFSFMLPLAESQDFPSTTIV